MRITASTAANPGYGMPPLDPSVLTDPAHGQSNLEWGLRYEAARARAAGLDPSTPAGQAQLLGAYNGGGDPNYVQHVQARMGGSQPTAVSDMAYNNAPAAPQQGYQQPAYAPDISYAPPPLPQQLQARLNDNSGLLQNLRSRQLLAAAQGFLSGTGSGAGNFSAGLGRAAGNVLSEQDQDAATAMDVYRTQMQQAQYGMLAQRYAGQLALAGGNLGVKQGQLDEKQRHDGVTEDQGQQVLGIKQQGADIRQQQVNQQGQIGQENAETGRYRVQNQAANLGAPPPPPLMSPQSPVAAPPGPSTPPTTAPSQGPQGASTGPGGNPAQGGLFSPPPASPPAPPSTVPSQLPGMGASGLSPNAFAPAGSIYDGEQGGLMSRRQTQSRVQVANHKENEADTSALEGFASADALANSQRALLEKVQAQNPGITGTGLLAKVQQFIATNTNDPTVQEVQKNASQLTAANYPHGVGALRIPELKVAADQAAGMGQNILAGGHLLDQQMAQRAQMREVLQARQNFISTHPQEDPTIAFDPVANQYLSQHPAYTEGTNGVIPAQPGLAAFDQAHTNPATGRFDPNYAAVQAGQKAFPSGGIQSADPVAAAAAAKAFPQANAQPPAPASPQGTTDPLAAQIRARLQDPAFRQRAIQARGQAWVDHYSSQ